MPHPFTPHAAAQPPASGKVPDSQRLYDLINSAWLTQAIYVAAELRLADAMRDGPRAVSALGQATGCVPDALFRLLRALCAAGICEDHGDGQFSLTSMGTLLCEDAPASLRGWARLWGQRLWPQWGTLLESVRTGDGWRKRIRQQEGYDHLKGAPDAAALFYEAMQSITRIVTSQAALIVDLSMAKRVVDVGGGHGEFLAAVLRAWPALHGICLDLPAAEAGARQLLSCAGLNSRAQFAAGDFFVRIPSADVLLLKSVLHNWDDARCGQVLVTCRHALAGHSQLLIVERVLSRSVSDCDLDRSLVQADLNMLVGVGGRERTLAQYEQMLAHAQFELARIHVLPLGFSLLECAVVTSQQRKRLN
jgi:hypothetical protein